MDSQTLRKKFLEFFESKGHKIVPSSSLMPENDPSVLLTTAGMQQFKPYYSGALDPLKDNHLGWNKQLGSKNVASIQKSFRTSDIDEVGDAAHLTFFEMLGNFSFGGYGKKEAIELGFEFITKVLGLKIDYVSVFAGEPLDSARDKSAIPADLESEKIWKEIDGSIEIRHAGRADNFWGPTGDQGPCGPTTEIYVDGVEIWNIVFNEFYQNPDGTLSKLDILGVDTGMGLERLAKVIQKVPTVFDTDLFSPIMASLPDEVDVKIKRIVADHMRASVFLIADGVIPSNKEQGYILRRLLRRAMAYAKLHDFPGDGPRELINTIVELYKQAYPVLQEKNEFIVNTIYEERARFGQTISEGLKQLSKMGNIDAKSAFYLYETYGLPFEFIRDKNPELKRGDFEQEFKKHQALSRTSSAGAFKGGLVDHEPQTIKHHTAHHLLLAALRQVLGEHVFQRGSNVSSERLRIDFSHPEKMKPEQIKQVEDIVNDAIAQDLEVRREEMPKTEAEKLGALAEFGAKYGDVVSVYTIFKKDGSVFSREFCGGPHVEHTGVLGKFRILKEEASSAGVRRIKAVVE